MKKLSKDEVLKQERNTLLSNKVIIQKGEGHFHQDCQKFIDDELRKMEKDKKRIPRGSNTCRNVDLSRTADNSKIGVYKNESTGELVVRHYNTRLYHKNAEGVRKLKIPVEGLSVSDTQLINTILSDQMPCFEIKKGKLYNKNKDKYYDFCANDAINLDLLNNY